MADVGDLQRREVHSAPLLGIVADSCQHAAERGVAQLHLLQQLGTRQVFGREQGAVVGGHVPGRVAGAHRLNQPREPVPQRGRRRAQLALGHVGLGYKFRQRHLVVGLVVHRQMAGGFRKEDEHGAEDQRHRGLLQLVALGVVVQVQAMLLGPSLHVGGQRGQGLLTDRAVQSGAQPDAEVDRLLLQVGEAVAGQGRGRQQRQEGAPVVAQQRVVQFEPVAGPAGGLHVEQAKAAAERQDAVAGASFLAVRRQQSLGRAAIAVQARQRARRLLRMHDRHRLAFVDRQVASARQAVQSIAQRRKGLAPRARRGREVGYRAAGGLPAGRVAPIAGFQRVAREEAVEG